MAQPTCAVDEPPLRLVGPDGQLSACHFADQLDGLESATELPAAVVEQAADKSVLLEEAVAAVVGSKPRVRLSMLAVLTFVLGLLSIVLPLELVDQDVTVRGGLVMLFGIAAVFAARRTRRDIFLASGALRGRLFVRFGAAFAWTALAVWGLYVALWIISLLPEATP
jgi:hypothetical protein